jgi:hypothetical protein
VKILSRFLPRSKGAAGVTCVVERHFSGTKPVSPRSEVTNGATSRQWVAEWRDPDDHAVELLEWLKSKNVEGLILAADVREEHQQMCRAKGWTPRKWQPVARELARRTTGGRKVYAWVGKHRLRVYPLYWAPVRGLSEREQRVSVVA